MIKVDISKKFKNLQMRFCFQSDSNRIVLFGASGCGKSTLLKMIAGFFNPDSGSISINDRVLYSSKNKQIIPAHLRNIGYLPQEYTLFPNMLVKDNILYGAKSKKIDISEEEFSYIIQKMDIENCIDRMPDTLSGGQQQRAALARVLIMKPEILLLDEPFSALDLPIRESLRDLVLEITEEMNIPAIFVTHDIEDAYIFAKDLMVIQDGIITEYSDKRSVYFTPKYVETAKLLDFKNIWHVTEIMDSIHLTNQNAEYICIRPENVMILRDDVPLNNNLKENMMVCRVTGIYGRGRYIQLNVESECGTKIIIHIPEHAFLKMTIEKNKKINVSLKQESIVYCKKRNKESE